MKKLIFACLSFWAVGCWGQQLPYQNPELSPEQRAEDLVRRLTLERLRRLWLGGQ